MKILSAETNLGSATNVSNAAVVRLFNSGDDNILVTRKDYTTAVMGSFMVLSGDVLYVEKYYTDTLEGSADVKATKIAYSSMMSFASSGGGGASSPPTYTHSLSATSVDEGGSFTTTITTTNVADGTNLYWELSGTNITSADFSSGALTGTASISSNSATFSHTVANDTYTEGTEVVTIKVYSDSGRNTQVGNTLTVTLADTSTTPVAGYSVNVDGDDFLTVGSSYSGQDLSMGTGDFTIECWARFVDTANRGVWQLSSTSSGLDTGNGSGVGTLAVSHNGGNWHCYTGGSGQMNGPSFNRTTNTWYHLAYVRASSVLKLYVNGTSVASVSDTYNYDGTTLCIGGYYTTSYLMNGNISNFRIVKGTALYTSNFTSPTSPLSNVSNTKLLCCNTSTVTGSTVTPATITTNGNPTASTDDPWD